MLVCAVWLSLFVCCLYVLCFSFIDTCCGMSLQYIIVCGSLGCFCLLRFGTLLFCLLGVTQLWFVLVLFGVFTVELGLWLLFMMWV